jgi:hypothetical protein
MLFKHPEYFDFEIPILTEARLRERYFGDFDLKVFSLSFFDFIQ